MYLIDYKPFYFYWNYVMFDLNTQINKLGDAEETGSWAPSPSLEQ